jgi:hypothetical protein
MTEVWLTCMHRYSKLSIAMHRSLISPTLFVLMAVILALNANGATVPFDTLNYNFQLGAGGGGSQATLSGATWEVFSDNFANKIGTHNDYSAVTTTLSTNANLDDTRFGEVSSSAWTAINLTGGSKTAKQTAKQDDKFFSNGAGSTGLARYEMAAYLVSLYNVAQGNSLSNESLQEAIWTLLDPKAEGRAPNPNRVDPSVDLENAANWYSTMNTPANLGALNAFLANYEVVSDPNMKFKRGLGVGGFEEQIVDPPARCAVPEPRGGIWMLIGLFAALGAFQLRRTRGALSAFTAHAN